MTAALKLERTVTLGLIATLFLQTAGALVWVGGAEARIEELERNVDINWSISERLARLEGESAMMQTMQVRRSFWCSIYRTGEGLASGRS